MWDYLFAYSQQSPSRTKSLLVSSFSHLEDHLHTWKTYCSIEILFTTLEVHALREAQIVACYSSSPCWCSRLT